MTDKWTRRQFIAALLAAPAAAYLKLPQGPEAVDTHNSYAKQTEFYFFSTPSGFSLGDFVRVSDHGVEYEGVVTDIGEWGNVKIVERNAFDE
jgi:hypothetical protein